VMLSWLCFGKGEQLVHCLYTGVICPYYAIQTISAVTWSDVHCQQTCFM